MSFLSSKGNIEKSSKWCKHYFSLNNIDKSQGFELVEMGHDKNNTEFVEKHYAYK